MKNLNFYLLTAILILCLSYLGIRQQNLMKNDRVLISQGFFLEKTGSFFNYCITPVHHESADISDRKVAAISGTGVFTLIRFKDQENTDFMYIQNETSEYQFIDNPALLVGEMAVLNLKWRKPVQLIEDLSLSGAKKLILNLIIFSIIILLTLSIMRIFKLKPLS